MRLLAIDTSADACSVGVAVDGTDAGASLRGRRPHPRRTADADGRGGDGRRGAGLRRSRAHRRHRRTGVVHRRPHRGRGGARAGARDRRRCRCASARSPSTPRTPARWRGAVPVVVAIAAGRGEIYGAAVCRRMGTRRRSRRWARPSIFAALVDRRGGPCRLRRRCARGGCRRGRADRAPPDGAGHRRARPAGAPCAGANRGAPPAVSSRRPTQSRRPTRESPGDDRLPFVSLRRAHPARRGRDVGGRRARRHPRASLRAAPGAARTSRRCSRERGTFALAVRREGDLRDAQDDRLRPGPRRRRRGGDPHHRGQAAMRAGAATAAR